MEGGAIYCYESSPTIYNNTIADNYNGGICCAAGSSPTIIDCIVWGNGEEDVHGCSGTYCCIEGGYPGEANIDQDPMFVPGPFSEYYLHPRQPVHRCREQVCRGGGAIENDDAGRRDAGHRRCRYGLSLSDSVAGLHANGMSTAAANRWDRQRSRAGR